MSTATERLLEHRTADLSTDGRYRYLLTRWWGDSDQTNRMRQRSPLFVMLNPSTADAAKDDHTIRKCRGFAERWGFEGLKVVNLYAYRTVSPKVLKQEGYPVGDRNKPVLLAEVMTAYRLNAPVVLAWGGHAEPHGVSSFFDLVQSAPGTEDITFRCLGTTNHGQPRHPLMLSYDTPLEQYVRTRLD